METVLSDGRQAAADGSGSSSSNGSGGSGNGAGAAAAAAARSRRPTWRIMPGICTESMAVDVARANRLPESVLARAEQLYDRMEAMRVRSELPGAPDAAAEAAAAAGAEGSSAGGERAAVAAWSASSSAAEAAAEQEAAAGAAAAPMISSSNGSSGSSNSQLTLADAADVLRRVAQHALTEHGWQEELQVGAGRARRLLARHGCGITAPRNCSSCTAESVPAGCRSSCSPTCRPPLHIPPPLPILPRACPQEVRFVLRGQQPGPGTTSQACAYVLRRPEDGLFYAGMSDNVTDRLRSHRQVGGARLPGPRAAPPAARLGRCAQAPRVCGRCPPGGGCEQLVPDSRPPTLRPNAPCAAPPAACRADQGAGRAERGDGVPVPGRRRAPGCAGWVGGRVVGSLAIYACLVRLLARRAALPRPALRAVLLPALASPAPWQPARPPAPPQSSPSRARCRRSCSAWASRR